jgi:2-haloacid dehalogenase
MSLEVAAKLRVLAFDVFGTVVDWHRTIAREVDLLELGVDGDTFALAWRSGYVPAMQRVASGELGWCKLDALHRIILDQLIERFAIAGLDESAKRHLNRVWHRLDPWPDSVEGLTRLKTRFTICTLSNGNLGLLTNLAKHAALPWDCVLSAELFKKYKPDPATYLGVADVFDLEPAQVALVAAHESDLAAASACGLATCYVDRPFEYGTARTKPAPAQLPEGTLRAASLIELAERLGC